MSLQLRRRRCLLSTTYPERIWYSVPVLNLGKSPVIFTKRLEEADESIRNRRVYHLDAATAWPTMLESPALFFCGYPRKEAPM